MSKIDWKEMRNLSSDERYEKLISMLPNSMKECEKCNGHPKIIYIPSLSTFMKKHPENPCHDCECEEYTEINDFFSNIV